MVIFPYKARGLLMVIDQKMRDDNRKKVIMFKLRAAVEILFNRRRTKMLMLPVNIAMRYEP